MIHEPVEEVRMAWGLGGSEECCCREPWELAGGLRGVIPSCAGVSPSRACTCTVRTWDRYGEISCHFE